MFRFGRAFLLIAGISSLTVPATENNWSVQMQEFSTILPEILVDLHRAPELSDETVLKRVKKNTARLGELSHKIVEAQKQKHKNGGPIDQDPTIGLLSAIFEDQLAQANLALEKGHTAYARSLLISTSSYCMSCHTRSNFGPKHLETAFKPSTEGLSQLEKADLYAATRQFDRALAQYQGMVTDKTFMTNDPFMWEQAVQKFLTLCVRVNRDPTLGIKVLKQIPRDERTAAFLSARVDKWIESLEDWKKRPNFKKGEDPLGPAKQLIEKGKQMQAYPEDASGSIYFLRASALLHDVLRTKLPNTKTAEAFFLAGKAYEAIDVLKIWALPEVYYQSCIEKSPHSSIAQQCYARLEESIYVGYTGSSGTHLPLDVVIKLDKLRGTSQPKKQTK